MIKAAADIITRAPGPLNIASDIISALGLFILRQDGVTATNPSFRHTAKRYDNLLTVFFNLRRSVCFVLYTRSRILQTFYILPPECVDELLCE
jgi:hypothetical protein